MLVGEEEYRNYEAALLADHIVQFSLAALGLEKAQMSPARRRSKRAKPSQKIVPHPNR
jgi:hypothetical protein